MDGLHSVALLHLQQVVRRQRHMMGDKSTIFVQYVMGEGTWGRRRSVPVMDGVRDFLERYLTFRAERLRTLGIESEAMFPPLRSGREFMRQQSFGGLKERVEKMLDAICDDITGRFNGMNLHVGTAYSGDPEIGLKWQKYVQSRLPRARVHTAPLALSIACHTGPGAVGVGCFYYEE